MCWGNGEGPHHTDVPLAHLVDLVLDARPAAISFEGANPRHEHEWKVFEDVKLPQGKVIIPGVLDSTTNFIEHPELVAQRLVRYAEVVGKTNVIAGSDCGFASWLSTQQLTPALPGRSSPPWPKERVWRASIFGEARSNPCVPKVDRRANRALHSDRNTGPPRRQLALLSGVCRHLREEVCHRPLRQLREARSWYPRADQGRPAQHLGFH